MRKPPPLFFMGTRDFEKIAAKKELNASARRRMLLSVGPEPFPVFSPRFDSPDDGPAARTSFGATRQSRRFLAMAGGFAVWAARLPHTITGRSNVMSALPPKADISGVSTDVCFVPRSGH
jgi:hypothetical protein